MLQASLEIPESIESMLWDTEKTNKNPQIPFSVFALSK
jgi:hypothetical protein